MSDETGTTPETGNPPAPADSTTPTVPPTTPEPPKPGPPPDRPDPKDLDEALARMAKMEAALAKANKEAETHRLAAEKLKQQTESDQEKSLRKAREEAETAASKAAEAKWKPRIVVSAVKVALKDAGFIGNNPDSLAKLVDMDAITVDDDGTVHGLDGEVKRFKSEFPPLFAGKSAGNANAGGGQTPPGKKQTSAERMAARALGRAS